MRLDPTETNAAILVLVLLLLVLASEVEHWQHKRRLRREARKQRLYWRLYDAQHPPARILPWTGNKR